MESMAVQ